MSKNRVSGWLVAAAVLCVAGTVLLILRSGNSESGRGTAGSVGPLEPLVIERVTSSDAVNSRSVLAKIVDRDAPRQQRIDLIRSLPEELEDGELERLLAEISDLSPESQDPGWRGQYLHEISLQLQRHPDLRERFGRVLVGVACDDTRARIERDYAVQHLRQVWHRSEEVDLRSAIRLRFEEIHTDFPDLADAALLSLHLLGTDPERPWTEADSVVSDGEIEPLVAAALNDSARTDQPGLTLVALRVFGDRSLEKLTEPVVRIASNPGAPTVVRMSAIATLVRSDAVPDEFFDSIDRSDPRIEEAVRLSLLNHR